ncbi:hypothetical protein EUTSA_v10017793mg [Eutrema salsugineum]|uniref:F-box domain-containing protein n=1 Tax=Eutrema salsugineum TaxID=72664 RepID=V4NY84_EUTSA|nr:hypothetical protein EUTSA_v10017793mg [Eutrema salsugineum]
MKSTELHWSEICTDALQLIFESLNFLDFHRARTVCSTWYSALKSRIAASGNRYPWLITFPEKFSISESCSLFDPVEDKTYETNDLGDELSESRCVASYGNWLLLLSPRLDFSVVNVFTAERFDLPSLSLSPKIGVSRFRRKYDGDLILEHSRRNREAIINRYINTAVLWVDGKTKAFSVFWIYNDLYLFSYKKGDDFWWHLQGPKAFCLYHDHYIMVLDYSGDLPNEIVEANPYLNHPFEYVPQLWEYIWKRRLAITVSGDVLIIVSLKGFPENQEKRLFYIFKMNLQGHEWERVDSLGDEMLVFGDGLTIVAKDDIGGGGISKRDSICFVADDVWPPKLCTEFQSCAGVFDLATTEISWSLSPFGCSNTRWFVPGSDKQ